MLPLIASVLVLIIAALFFGKIAIRSKKGARDHRRYALAKAHHEFMINSGDRRGIAADVLAGTGDPHVIPTLLRGRRDPIKSDPEDGCVARALQSLCESLGLDAAQTRRDYDLKIIGLTPIDDLLPWFNSSDPILRDAAMQRIAVALRVSPSGELAEQILNLAFSCSAEFYFRQRAADTLAMARQEDRLVHRAIEILEASPDINLDREDAIEVLSRFDAGPDAIPCLIKQAQEQRWSMSPRAIRALTRILRSRGEKLPIEALESIGSLLTRPVLVAVAAPNDLGNVSVETVNTSELQTLVSDLLANRHPPDGEK